MEKRSEGLSIERADKKLFIEEKRIYKTLHNCDLLEKRLEDIRTVFAEKYGCDYLGVHLFNKDSDLFFSNLDNDPWHMFYWQNFMGNCPTLKISSKLKKGENGFLFFFDYNNMRPTIRADIVGEHKDGFTIMFHNDKSGNKVQFSLTFKDNKSIASFSPETFRELILDLKKAEAVIDDFIEYFETYGELKNSENLKTFIKKKNYILPL